MGTDGKPVWRRLIALGVTLLAATVAEAQDTAPKPPLWADWTTQVTVKLHLDGAQSAALDRYLVTMSRQPGIAETTSDAYRALTFPQRLDYFVANIEADLTKIRASAAAMDAFYAMLTPAQQTLLNGSMLPHPGNLATASYTKYDGPPRAPDFQLPSHVDPDWAVMPSPDDIARVYPSAAVAAKVSGKVTMSCVADTDGLLTECVIQSETPPGQGFGNAALEVSAYMRMKPASNFGVPVRARVNIPVNFALEADVGQR